MHRQHEHGLGHGRGPGFISVSTILLIVANLLIPAAILIFATGFFPYKPFLPGLAEYKSVVSGSPPEAPFDRVIFMVVDALRRYAFLQLQLPLAVLPQRRVASRRVASQRGKRGKHVLRSICVCVHVSVLTDWYN